MRAKKTSANNLKNVARHDWLGSECLNLEERALYTQTVGREKYDFVFDPKPNTGRLIVFFSGDARRSKFEPPVFQRWSWASRFPASCLYFSDPALYHHDKLGLAWYAGYAGGDYLTHIWSVVEAMLPKLELSPQNVFAYGSSGGGYAALRSALYFAGVKVVAINPQTDLWKYPVKATKRLARAAYGAENLYQVDEREHYKFTALNQGVLSKAEKIFLAQNEVDEEHYEHHYQPFVEMADSTPYAQRLVTTTFSDESGHAKAEDKETVDKVLDFIQERPRG